MNQTTRLLQQAERRHNVASSWKVRVSGLLSEQSDEQVADSVHLGRALRHLQALQEVLADNHALWKRRLMQVGVTLHSRRYHCMLVDHRLAMEYGRRSAALAWMLVKMQTTV